MSVQRQLRLLNSNPRMTSSTRADADDDRHQRADRVDIVGVRAAFLIIVLGISLSRMTIVNKRAGEKVGRRAALGRPALLVAHQEEISREGHARRRAPSTTMKPMIPHQVRLLGPNLWVGSSATSSVKRGSRIM